MKSVSIILVVLIVGLTGFIAFKKSQNAGKMQQDLNQERYVRMTTEENLSKSNEHVKEMEEQVAKLEKKMASMQIVLDNTNAINEDLKARLDKAGQIKQDMDVKIKELEQMAGASQPTPPPVEAAPAPAPASY